MKQKFKDNAGIIIGAIITVIGLAFFAIGGTLNVLNGG